MIASLNLFAASVLQADEPLPNDGVGTVSLHPIWAPLKVVVIGGLATLIVFLLLWKFAWPSISAAMKARTQRIQDELDQSAAAREQAEAEAAQIRTALGDVDAERERLFAEYDAQAAALLEDGRARLAAEIADLEAKADADIATAAGRGAEDLRAEIARYSSDAIESSVRTSLDDAAQQDLIENFIARVGTGAGS